MTLNIGKNKKLMLVLVGVTVALVLVVGALAFNLITSQDDNAQASILEDEEFLAQTEEYVNESGDYSIRYYAEWFYRESETDDRDVGLYTDFQSINDAYLENLKIDYVENSSVQDYLAANGLETSEPVTLGGAQAEKIGYTSSFGESEVQTVGYIFSQEGDLYVVEYSGEIGGDYEKFLAPAERMIESFEF